MLKKYSPREKAMLIVVIALIVIMIAKSLFFDEVRNLSGDEQYMYEFARYSIAQEHDGFLSKNHLVVYRIFDIFKADPKVTSVLRYDDPVTGQFVERRLDGRYTARVRGYILWIIPYKSFSITAQVAE